MLQKRLGQTHQSARMENVACLNKFNDLTVWVLRGL